MFQLGHHGSEKGGLIAPIRSSSALILSSTNINRERIYAQQPPISASGYSSQAFGAHFPHTVRTAETKTCDDCHVSAAGDNNAIMAQLMMLGTNFVNFIGMHAWVGLDHGLEAVRVTEWSEPQAVFGSYLQRYAYPDFYKLHVEKNHRELIDWTRGRPFDPARKGSGETKATEEIANIHHPADGRHPLSSASRRVSVRGRGQGRFPGLRCREHRQQRRFRKDRDGAVLAAGPERSRRLAQRDLHGPADQPAHRADPQYAEHGDRRAEHARAEPRGGLPPALPLRRGDRRRGRPDPGRRRHPGRPRATQQLPQARADVEPEQRAEGRAPRHPGRFIRLYRRRRGIGGGQPGRSAEAASRSRTGPAGRARLGAAVPLSVRDRRAGPRRRRCLEA